MPLVTHETEEQHSSQSSSSAAQGHWRDSVGLKKQQSLTKNGVNGRKASILIYAKPRQSSWQEGRGIFPMGDLTTRTLHQHIKRQYCSKEKEKHRTAFKRFLQGLYPPTTTWPWCIKAMKCQGVEDQPCSRGHFLPQTQPFIQHHSVGNRGVPPPGTCYCEGPAMNCVFLQPFPPNWIFIMIRAIYWKQLLITHTSPVGRMHSKMSILVGISLMLYLPQFHPWMFSNRAGSKFFI